MTHPATEKLIRNTTAARINHWITAGLLRAAVAVRPVDVPSDAVLSFGVVRRRPVDAGGPSLDRDRAADELCRADRAVLARQSVEPGRYRLDARRSTASW